MIKNNSSTDKASVINKILSGILIFASFVLVFLCRWVFTTWNGLRMDELIFQLKAPIEGTGDGIVMKGVVSSILPAVILTSLFFVFLYLIEKMSEGNRAAGEEDQGKLFLFGGRVMALLLIAGTLVFAGRRLELKDYIRNQMDESRFIEDNYVDPADVSIRFP